MHIPILRGDVFFADLDPVLGSEQGGTRPVLVVQNNTGNRHSPSTIVAAITHKAQPSLPTHVLIDAPGVKEGSVILLEQLRTIDGRRLAERLCALDARQMHLVDIALLASLGIRFTPQNAMLMTLCRSCAQSFRDAGGHILRQVNSDQDAKEPCTVCNVRSGFDYEVTRL